MNSCASQQLQGGSGQHHWQHSVFRFRGAEHIHPWKPVQLASSQDQIEILLHDTALDSRDLFKNAANGKCVKSTSLLPQNDSCKLISGSSTSCLELSGLSVWEGHTGHTCSFLTLKLMASRGEKWRFSLRKAGFGSSGYGCCKYTLQRNNSAWVNLKMEHNSYWFFYQVCLSSLRKISYLIKVFGRIKEGKTWCSWCNSLCLLKI